jgi:hypothetical protein
MPVQSQELVNGQLPPQRRTVDAGGWIRGVSARFAGGLGLIAFGLSLWVPAARFTADGWVAWLNGLAGWLTIAERVPRLGGWGLVVVALIVGGAYSVVEIIWQPLQITWFEDAQGRRRTRWVVLPLAIWVLWLLATATDIGTTYVGLLLPPPDALPAWRDLARSQDACAVLAVVLTFAPNWLILAGIQLLLGRK